MVIYSSYPPRSGGITLNFPLNCGPARGHNFTRNLVNLSTPNAGDIILLDWTISLSNRFHQDNKQKNYLAISCILFRDMIKHLDQDEENEYEFYKEESLVDDNDDGYELKIKLLMELVI